MEFACLDILGQKWGVLVCDILGGKLRDHVPFASYLAATAIGVIPSTVIYAYFADSLIEGVGNGRADALISLVIASVLLISLSLAPRWFNRDKATTRSVSESPAIRDEATR